MVTAILASTLTRNSGVVASQLRLPVMAAVLRTNSSYLIKDEATQAYGYAVLVTNTQYDLQAIAQLYRDRADCENGFDELKNQ